MPFWDGGAEARTLKLGGGGAGGDATSSVIFGCRDPVLATAMLSPTGSVLIFFLAGFDVPGGARGLRDFFSFASAAVELPVCVAGSLFLRGFFTAGTAAAALWLLAFAGAGADANLGPPPTVMAS